MSRRSTTARRAAAGSFAAAVLLSGAARAGDPAREAVVVDVAPKGALDAYRLRAAIGVELGVDAVGADDPRAQGARGAFSVGVDRDTHHLTVSYKARETPVERTVDLPSDPEAAQRAAVLLAGNLGRDEASELAAQLRHTPAPAPAPAPTPTPTPAPAPAPAPDEGLDARSLQAAIEYSADQDRRQRTALVWTTLGLGVVGAGAVAAASWMNPPKTGNPPIPAAVAFGGPPIGALIGSALILAVVPSGLEDVATAGRNNNWEPGVVADVWRKRAAVERSSRRVAGAMLVVAGCVELALGIGLALDQSSNEDPGVRATDAAASIGVAVLSTLLGVSLRTGDGPLESALHAYERSHGMPLWGLAQHVAFSATPSGATAGFRTTF